MSKLKSIVQAAVAEAGKALLAKFDLVNLKTSLKDLPLQIQYTKQRVAGLREALIDATRNRDQEEAILVSLIAGEINPASGKAVYTNKEARDAELITRERTSATYLIADNAVKQAERELNEATFALEKLQDEFKSLRIIARIVCKEMALLGLDDEEEDDNELY